MTSPQTLGALSTAHQLLTQLPARIPERDVNRRLHPDIEPLGRLLGRSMYLETYWLRQVVTEDDEMTRCVRHLFAYDAPAPSERDERLPRLPNCRAFASPSDR